jgi:hypothetical protein
MRPIRFSVTVGRGSSSSNDHHTADDKAYTPNCIRKLASKARRIFRCGRPKEELDRKKNEISTADGGVAMRRAQWMCEDLIGALRIPQEEDEAASDDWHNVQARLDRYSLHIPRTEEEIPVLEKEVQQISDILERSMLA